MRFSLYAVFVLLLGSIPLVSLQGQETTETEKSSFSLSDLPLEWQGFIDTRHGPRIEDDPYQTNAYSLSETRLQLQLGLRDLE